jgi:lipoate-protein ligase A
LAVSAHPAIRVLQDPALEGAANMARDEALLRRVGIHESPPTLRLYQWDPPTISLGYFQPIAQYDSLDPPAGNLPVVRRLTGGGAILHDLELTYSLILPVDHALLEGGANRLYEMVHDAVIVCLRAFQVGAARDGETDGSGPTRGPFFCFDRRHSLDVLLGSDKIAGSAQRRTRQSILQHGSIILANRYNQQSTAVLSMPFEESIRRARELLVTELATLTGMDFTPGVWSRGELDEAQNLIVKYAGDEWTRRV